MAGEYIRSTQEVVEVLRTTTPNVRATQIVVEVLRKYVSEEEGAVVQPVICIMM